MFTSDPSSEQQPLLQIACLGSEYTYAPELFCRQVSAVCMVPLAHTFNRGSADIHASAGFQACLR